MGRGAGLLGCWALPPPLPPPPHLCAVVAGEEGDAHLGEDLEQPLLQRLLEVLLRVLGAHVGHLGGAGGQGVGGAGSLLGATCLLLYVQHRGEQPPGAGGKGLQP